MIIKFKKKDLKKMYHQRESAILFFLSVILPVDICYGILNMMKTAELEDARQEYMEYMDIKTITDTGDTSSNDSFDPVVSFMRQFVRSHFIRENVIYRNINSTEQTRKNIKKIQRLSGTGSGWSSGSVTNEANSELAEKTASQIMLDRAITDRVEKKYINYFYNNTYNNINETYNDIIVNNINYEIKYNKNETIDKTYYKREHKNSVKKKMKNNKPPRIEKAFMNKSFRNKCR